MTGLPGRRWNCICLPASPVIELVQPCHGSLRTMPLKKGQKDKNFKKMLAYFRIV